MGLNNKSNLRTQADAIRNEDGEGKNTAERVGKALVEIIESADLSLTTETNARVQKDSQLSTDIATTLSIATNASTIATQAKSEASTADAKAVTAQDTANNAKSIAESAKAVTDGKGIAGGIAPLDANGFVPSQHLPGYVDDVVEFNSMVDNVTTQNVGSIKKSTDAGCMVVYDKTRNRFLLAVSRKTSAGSELATQSQNVDAFAIGNSLFDYYVVWADANLYGEDSASGRIPNTGKIYTCAANNKTFRWGGTTLVVIGSDLALGHTSATAFPGDEGEMLTARMGEAEVSIGSLQSKSAIDHSSIVALQGEVDNLSSGKADVSEVERIKANVTTAINSSNAAMQSVCAAFTCATEAKTASTAAVERVDALEARTSFEEIASEEEWEARKNAGTLDADKLYFIAEV